MLAPTVPQHSTGIEPTVVSFVGDMMWDRYIRAQADSNGYNAILKPVSDMFASSSYIISNLEGPITSYAPVADYRVQDQNHYRFTFATTVAKTLADFGFGAVTLANNHIMDFGESGVAQTTGRLLENGVGYAGAPDDPYTPWHADGGSVPLVLYAYDDWYANDVGELEKRLRAESQDVFVVVFSHWGDDYEQEPNASQETVARRFVDAGADLVIGSHTHVIGKKEQYKGVWIYYSLGNFVFDQYFSEAVRCGAVLHVTLVPGHSPVLTESFIELASDGTTKPSACATVVPERTS